MRNLFLCIIVLCLAITGCKKNDNDTLQQGYKFVATLDLSSIEISSQPMIDGTLKGAAPQEDLYAIQIKEKDGDKLIAKGLFTGTQIQAFKNAELDKDKLHVELKHNIEYCIEACMVVSSANIVKNSENDNEYSYPFGSENATGELTYTSITSDSWEVVDRDDVFPFYNLSENYGTKNPYTTHMVESDRWYFLNSSYIADYNNPSIAIEMKRASFQTVFNVTNLATNIKVVALIGIENTETTEIKDYSDYTNLNRIDFTSQNGLATGTRIYNIEDIAASVATNTGYDYLVEFYIFNQSDEINITDKTDRDKAVKVLSATFTAERNTKYNITLDANTNTDYQISITANEEWIDKTVNPANDIKAD